MSRKHVGLCRVIQIPRRWLKGVARYILLCLPPSFSSSCPIVWMGAMLTTELDSQQGNYVTGAVRRDLDLLLIFTESEGMRLGGVTGCHLVQPPCLSRLLRIGSRGF